MVWFLLCGILSVMTPAAAADLGAQRVPIRGDFFGTRFHTHLEVGFDDGHQTLNALRVLEKNVEQLKDMNRWVDSSSERFDFDDYGVFRLVVSSIDGMDIVLKPSSDREFSTLAQAIRRGWWSKNERILAIGGALRTLGYAVSLYSLPDNTLLLGLGTQDPDLNVASISVNWTIGSGNQEREVFVEWMLWDGFSRLGHFEMTEGQQTLDDLVHLESEPPTDRFFSFMERRNPSFTVRKKTSVEVPVEDTRAGLRMTHYPNLARWYALYPEFDFARQVQFVKQERDLLRMGPSIRRIVSQSDGEEEAVNRILRAIQAHFTYQIGPLRSMSEVVDSRVAKCDQMAMMMLISLLEMGFEKDELVTLHWPQHLALGVRARGAEPEGHSVSLANGRFFVLDMTYYVYENKRLVSRWGGLSDEYGVDIQVGSLAALH